MPDNYVCPECGQNHIRRPRRDQATPQRTALGCARTFGLAFALGIVLWLFILGALVPYAVEFIRAL